MSNPRGLFCQSCSMPMANPEDFGTNADGTENSEFCRFCFQKGAFTEPDTTVDRMIEKCAAMMKQMDIPDEQIDQTKAFIPLLRRWRKA